MYPPDAHQVAHYNRSAGRVTWEYVVTLATSKGLIAEKRGKKYFVDNNQGAEGEFNTVSEAYSAVYYNEV